MNISVYCPAKGKSQSMTIGCTTLEYLQGRTMIENGMSAVEAYPMLNKDELEFLNTGLYPEDWDQIMAETTTGAAEPFGINVPQLEQLG